MNSDRSIVAYDAKWNMLWTNSNTLMTLPPALNHLGDIAYSGGYIYGPAEDFTSCTAYSPVMLAVYDGSTGQPVTWSDISADQHEASSVAVDAADNQVIVSSYCPDSNGSNTTLWVYDLSALTTNAPGSKLAYTSTITLSKSVPLIQGVSWNADARLFAISADINFNGPAGSLWLASEDGVVTGPVYVVPASAGTELEGIDYSSGYLYFLEGGIVWGIGKPATPPTLSVAGGSYCAPQTVSISDSTAGASIYYTTDGSMPTTNSTLYSGPIEISSSETVNTIAGVTGSASSVRTTASYNISPAATCSSSRTGQ